MSAQLERRCFDLMLSMRYAKAQRSESRSESAPAVEQEAPRRVLLEVEQKAHFYKDLQGEHKQAVSNNVQNELDAMIMADFDKKLGDVEHMFKHVLGCPDNIPAALDILQVRAASIGRLHPLLSDISWLNRNILHIVNLPQYRNSQQPDTKIESARHAMSYLGIENLKLVVPSSAVRNLLPKTTEPFRLLRRKLWDTVLASGLSAQSLAKSKEKDLFTAYCGGLFFYLGHIAVVSLYLSLFSEYKLKQLERFRKEDRYSQYDVLLDTKPEEKKLVDLMLGHGIKLSADLAEYMDFKRLMIAKPLRELVNADPEFTLSDEASLLKKAITYSQFRMLEKHNLIDEIEAKRWLKSVGLKKSELAALKTVRLNRLNLSFDR